MIIWKWCQFNLSFKLIGICLWWTFQKKYYNYHFEIHIYKGLDKYNSIKDVPNILNIGFGVE